MGGSGSKTVDNEAKKNDKNNPNYLENVDQSKAKECNIYPSEYHGNDENSSMDYPTLEEINQAIKKKYEDNSKECPICLEPYGQRLPKKIILCGHCFCVVCIDKALELHPFCPLCRKQNINEENKSKYT